MKPIVVLLALTSLTPITVIAQHAPTDAQLLYRVSAVLENENAFRGLQIVPKVSHGTVILSGTVSSEGDKVLAAEEFGQVAGVKTVENNLDVRSDGKLAQLPALTNPNGAQSQALTSQPQAPRPKAAPGAITENTVSVPVGSILQIRLEDPLNSKTAKPDDHFHGTVAAPVYAGGAIAIPDGTPVLGRVVSAKPSGHFVAAAELSLELTTIRLPEADGHGEDTGIITDYASSDGRGRGSNTAVKTGGGAAIGAVSGGGIGFGSNALSRGGQIELKPETLLRFKLASPILATVYQKNGQQIQIPAAQGPGLMPRPLDASTQ